MTRLPLLLLMMTGAAHALNVGQPAPLVIFEETNGKKVTLPQSRVTLIFYEDKDAGPQNQRTRDVVGPITDMKENKPLLNFMAVADLEKWNWFPAKNYALKEMAKIEKKEDCTLYADWHGIVRKSWKLTKAKSGIILLDSEGVVRFFGEGPLKPEQTDDLVKQLAALGMKTR
jgi:predicted transcriptional regulator